LFKPLSLYVSMKFLKISSISRRHLLSFYHKKYFDHKKVRKGVSMIRNIVSVIIVYVSFLALVSCGGGGGDSGGSGGDSGDNSDGNVAVHSNLAWDGSPGVCLSCHADEAEDMYASTHYQWQGDAQYMVNGPQKQGKITGAVNSYCINILGNWTGCGNCHVGLGIEPQVSEVSTQTQLENIDCLVCHQKEYKRKKVDGIFVPDTSNMTITLNEAAQTVHLPERANCLQCHAKAGGGDAVKRGDLALASANTADNHYDIHMSISAGDLKCQECHTVQDHRFAGKGSDIRPTDLDIQILCSTCHYDKDESGDHSSSAINRHTDEDESGVHSSSTINRHVARVACQTCHIPFYAKDANDSDASEATEIHRTWRSTSSPVAPFHPESTKANNLIPEYRFWNRYSKNYLLGDIAQFDSSTNAYPTSRPEGYVDDDYPDSKLYPFKYKTAEQPILDTTSQLIALDTKVYFETADPDLATTAGLVNMGHVGNENYSWIITDTYQLLNHQISPASEALTCTDCHGDTARMDLKGELGYELKAPKSQVCTQCHGQEENKGFYDLHEEHVKEEKYDCSHCHTFARPERNLN
jgi:Cytochrome c bacterial